MAVGKNLFAFFSSHGKDGDSDDLVVMHVHFGMSGMWAVFNSTMEEPDVKPTTRLRLEEIISPSSPSSTVGKMCTHLSAGWVLGVCD